ncbi:MAG: hypothetical protein U0794_14620 [Isosphaeraceae bacterium]
MMRSSGNRTRRSTHRHRPGVETLEVRSLLSGLPTATWVGQDLHDLAGGASSGAGNGVQDIHIALGNLPAARTISSVNMLGYGGGQWVVNIGNYNPFNGSLVRISGSTTGDLYVDPYMNETGRSFTITFTYDNGTSDTINLQGGTANANLRMPAYAATASWSGQNGPDVTGVGAGVGPDGYVDAHLTLGHLFPGTAVSLVTLTRPSGLGWGSGMNPGALNNAEFVPSATDPTTGDLYFSPDTDLFGVNLTVTITYADGKVDHTSLVAGHTSATMAAPSPSPVSVVWDSFHVAWLGQDGTALTGPGDVHLTLSGLPAGRTILAAALGDQVGLSWFYAKPGSGQTTTDPNSGPLALTTAADGTVNLAFPPGRDETGGSLLLHLTLDDGSHLATQFSGGSADPGLRAADISSTSVVAHPGDDLNDLANRFGTVRLSAGLYPMTQPLVLRHPVTITGDSGATLVFYQAPTDPTWTAAIKVLVSHITLNNFAVRFAGPIRWTDGISYGPAVIGAIDNYDAWVGDPRVDLSFTHLDLQAPPASSTWEEAPRLFRMANATSGRIADNRLKGGSTEVFNGPWLVSNNTYLGALTNTYAYDAFAGHGTHDVTISGNHVEPVGPSGKTWRFLVMTQTGANDTILNNTVVNIGMMDTDTVPNPNAPEIILTESYRLHYEGQVASVSADGRVVQIYNPQNGPARAGDVLSILSGPQVGLWVRVEAALDANTYLLDSPITPGKFAVSLASGFVNETYQGNSIDARGSTHADDLVLAGNQFGARVIGNQLMGGNHAFRISAVPTEMPGPWGWSHAPFLGATVMGNTVTDSMVGGYLDVERNGYTKLSTGRVYFTGSFLFNTGVWTSAFLTRRAAAGRSDQPVLVSVGNAQIADPWEVVINASGNQVTGPAGVTSGPTLYIFNGIYNGQAYHNQGIVLPGFAPPPPPPPQILAPAAEAATSAPPASAPATTPSSATVTTTASPISASSVASSPTGTTHSAERVAPASWTRTSILALHRRGSTPHRPTPPSSKSALKGAHNEKPAHRLRAN